MKKLDQPSTASITEHLCTLPPYKVADADPHAWLKDSESWKTPSGPSKSKVGPAPTVDLASAVDECIRLKLILKLAELDRDGWMVRCNALIKRVKELDRQLKRQRAAA